MEAGAVDEVGCGGIRLYDIFSGVDKSVSRDTYQLVGHANLSKM